MQTGPKEWTTIARVQRDQLTGETSLILIEDERRVEITDGAEYLTVRTKVDPFTPSSV